jgi:hypothetical protein
MHNKDDKKRGDQWRKVSASQKVQKWGHTHILSFSRQESDVDTYVLDFKCESSPTPYLWQKCELFVFIKVNLRFKTVKLT